MCTVREVFCLKLWKYVEITFLCLGQRRKIFLPRATHDMVVSEWLWPCFWQRLLLGNREHQSKMRHDAWHILKFMQDCTHCRWLKTSKNTGPIGCSRPGFHWLLPTVVHGWTQSSRLWHLAAQVTVGVAIVAIRSAAHVLRLKVLLESLGLVGLVGLEPVKPVKFTAMIACEVLSMAWLWQAMAELCALPGRELRRARVHQLQQHETCLGHRQLSYSA